MSSLAATLLRVLVAIGGTALLIAMGVDSIALAGRNLGMPLLGSIEIIQAAVLVSGTTAILVATLAATHARVRLLTERATPRMRSAMERASSICSAAFFLALAAGSFWILADLWSGQEESELLHLAYRPLRLCAALVLLAVATVFLVRALAGKRQ